MVGDNSKAKVQLWVAVNAVLDVHVLPGAKL
jgi:hypothetical protein